MTTGYFYTERAIGNREDLTDVLTNISPTETPFMSSIGRTTAKSTLHEWQTDALAAAAANAQDEGFSAAEILASGNVTTRVNNRTQIFAKVATITGTERAMNPAGRSDEFSYQIEKRVKELARDIELQLVRSSAAVAGDTTADTGAQLEGLGLGTNIVSTTSADGGFLSSNIETAITAATATGTRKNLTEARFNNLLQTIWTAGGRPDAVHANGYHKRVISAFTSNNTRFLSVAPNAGIQLNTDVEIYRSDFGSVRVVLNRYVGPTTMGAVETQYFKMAILRPLQRIMQGSTGDRDAVLLLTELTLCGYSPTSGGKWELMASALGATT